MEALADSTVWYGGPFLNRRSQEVLLVFRRSAGGLLVLGQEDSPFGAARQGIRRPVKRSDPASVEATDDLGTGAFRAKALVHCQKP